MDRADLVDRIRELRKEITELLKFKEAVKEIDFLLRKTKHENEITTDTIKRLIENQMRYY
uniref:Uncharacterized protein n=1 Tax=viral metagenome TaxID=1070528 RepID=A0A6H1ZNE5_9ZZZZ